MMGYSNFNLCIISLIPIYFLLCFFMQSQCPDLAIILFPDTSKNLEDKLTYSNYLSLVDHEITSCTYKVVKGQGIFREGQVTLHIFFIFSPFCVFIGFIQSHAVAIKLLIGTPITTTQ